MVKGATYRYLKRGVREEKVKNHWFSYTYVFGGTHYVICMSHKFFNMGTTAEIAGRGAKFMVLPPLLNA